MPDLCGHLGFVFVLKAGELPQHFPDTRTGAGMTGLLYPLSLEGRGQRIRQRVRVIINREGVIHGLNDLMPGAITRLDGPERSAAW